MASLTPSAGLNIGLSVRHTVYSDIDAMFVYSYSVAILNNYEPMSLLLEIIISSFPLGLNRFYDWYYVLLV